MCGIVGILNLDKRAVSRVVLQRMTDMITHRGPDDAGVYVDSFLGLGHRRLAIIDLSPLGHQPMMTEDGNLVITYNGEVYNFMEIRTELEALGYTFRSRTDTEVILKAFQEWDIEAVKKFNGMFAFGIWDKKNKRLILARDRYGIKPLYYYRSGNTFIFSSEIKVFFPHPEFKKSLNKSALLEYFTFQNIFTDRTLFEGVTLLPQGTIFEIDVDSLNFKKYKYWDYDFQENEEYYLEEECIEELDRLFHQAVERQLISDVEIGAYLSGGIDSGSITAIAARHFPYLKTFCVGYDQYSVSGLEYAYDERPKAEFISYLNKTEHYEMVLKSGDMERCMKDLIWHLEDLRVGQSYPNFYVAKLAGKFVKVVLSGAGGDELFGGYPWRYYRTLRSLNFEDYIDNYYLYWQRLIPNKSLRKVFTPIWKDVKDVWTRDIFKNVFEIPIKEINSPEEYINYSLYFEAKTFLHGLLVVEDKLAMAFGLETRVPFLDNDLVEFAQKIPVRYKLKNIDKVLRIDENEPAKLKKYFVKTNDGKIILRKTLKKYVPEDIINQIKQGFTAPDEAWFRGESIEYIKKIIFDKKAYIYNFFDYNTVVELVNEHFERKRNRRLFIWSLISFEWWLRVFEVS